MCISNHALFVTDRKGFLHIFTPPHLLDVEVPSEPNVNRNTTNKQVQGTSPPIHTPTPTSCFSLAGGHTNKSPFIFLPIISSPSPASKCEWDLHGNEPQTKLNPHIEMACH